MFNNWSAMKGYKFLKCLTIIVYTLIIGLILFIPFDDKKMITVKAEVEQRIEKMIDESRYVDCSDIGNLNRFKLSEEISRKIEDYNTYLLAESNEEEIVEDLIEYTEYVTTADYLNHRSKPEINEENVIEVFPYGTVVQVVSIDGDWAKLVDDTYISSYYIKDTLEDVDEPVIENAGIEMEEYCESPSIPTMGYVDTSFDIYTLSGATVGNMYNITSTNPGLTGLEEAIIDAEQTYGINAYFLMALAAYESGWGSSDLALYNNNFYGLRYQDWLSFGSPAESVYMAAQSIQSYGVSSVNDIAYIYCPDGNSLGWAMNVVSIINQISGY